MRGPTPCSRCPWTRRGAIFFFFFLFLFPAGYLESLSPKSEGKGWVNLLALKWVGASLMGVVSPCVLVTPWVLVIPWVVISVLEAKKQVEAALGDKKGSGAGSRKPLRGCDEGDVGRNLGIPQRPNGQ